MNNPLLRTLFGPKRLGAEPDTVDVGTYQDAAGAPILAYHPSTRALDVHASALTLDGAPVGGGSSAQVFEVTNLLIPAGTNLSGVGHVLGTLDVVAGAFYLAAFYLELAEALTSPDAIGLAEWETPGDAYGSNDLGGYISAVGPTVARSFAVGTLLAIDDLRAPGTTLTTNPAVDGTVTVGIYTHVATAADITVVRARASFLTL